MAHAYDPHAATASGDFSQGDAPAPASRVEIDWSRPEAVSAAVVEALASATDSGPMDLDPLYDHVDLEALECFLAHRKRRSDAHETSATFTVDGYTVAVRGDQVMVAESR